MVTSESVTLAKLKKLAKARAKVALMNETQSTRPPSKSVSTLDSYVYLDGCTVERHVSIVVMDNHIHPQDNVS